MRVARLIAIIAMNVSAIVAFAALTPAAADASGCENSWTNTKGGSWFEAENWSKKAVPTSGEEACITEAGTYSVTMTQTSGTGTVTVKSLTVGGSSGTQTLDVGSSSTLNAVLTTTSGIGVTTAGVIAITNGDGSGNNVTVVSPITNAGTIASEPANGGTRTLQGNITNTGTLAINTNTSYNGASTALTNTGRLNVAEGKKLSVSAKNSVTNGAGGQIAGTGSGDVFVEKEGSFAEGAGTTSGTKPVIIDDGALSYTGAGTSAIALHGEGSTLKGNLSSGQSLSIESTSSENAKTTAAASFSNSGSITLTNGDSSGNNVTFLISKDGTLTNSGTLTTEVAHGGTRSIQGNLTNTGTLAVDAKTTFNGSKRLLTNEGTLNVAKGIQLTVAAGSSFTNGTGGKITAGTGGSVFLSGGTLGGTFIEGAGTTSGTLPVIVRDAALDYSGSGSSTIALRGNSSLSGASSPGQSLLIESTSSENAVTTIAASFTNAGSIKLTNGDTSGNNDTVVISGGTLTNSGTLSTELAHGGVRALQGNITNTGKLVINTNTAINGSKGLLTNEGTLKVAESKQLTVSNESSVANGSGGKIVGAGTGDLFQSGGTFTEGAGTTSGTQPVFVDDGTLSYTGAGSSLIKLRGNTALTGNVSVGQTLVIESTSGENATATAPGSFTNAGLITMTNGDTAGNNATLILSSGTLTNSGTLTAVDPIGGTRTIQGNLTNTGTLAIETNTTYNGSGTVLTNEGTVNIAESKQLLVSNTASFTNAVGGKIVAVGTGDLFQSGGTFTEGAGTTSGTQPVFVDDGTLSYTGAGSSLIKLRGNTALTGNVSVGQTLVIESTSGENATATAPGSFTNAGLITMTNGDTAGNNATLILSSGTLTNSGTLTTEVAHGGTRTIQGNLTNTGTLAINTNTTYNATEATLLNNGAINVANGVALTAPSKETITNEGGTIAGSESGALVQTGGTFNEGLGTTAGSEPVILDDLALNYTGKGASTIALRGNSTLSGTISFGQVLSIQSTSSEHAVVTPTLVKGVYTSNGTLVLTNGDGAGNNATISLSGGTFTNNGTLDAEEPHGGVRTIEGNLKNEKTVVLGAGADLKVTGTYTQGKSGTLKTEINSGSSYGALSITGTAAIDGTLTLVQSKTFLAKAGETFAILSSAALTGTFATETSDSVAGTPGLYYKPTYSATGVTLVVTQATLVLSPTSGLPGSVVKLSGSGYPPEDTITPTFTDHAKVQTVFPGVKTNSGGEFSTEVTIPGSAAVGSGSISVKGTLTGVSISETFSVT